MSKKQLGDEILLEINGFPMHLEVYDSELIVKDENNNSMRITKKRQQSIVLELKGSFSSKK